MCGGGGGGGGGGVSMKRFHMPLLHYSVSFSSLLLDRKTSETWACALRVPFDLFFSKLYFEMI